MNSTGIIDKFLDTYSSYINSGFGLLGGEVTFLATTLVVIDLILAALFWVLSDEDIIVGLIKKTLYVGFFAFLINNWQSFTTIIFDSFAGLGLKAAGSTLTIKQLLQPSTIAQKGLDAGEPISLAIQHLPGSIFEASYWGTLLGLWAAWLIILLSFFVLAVQLFVVLVEFKITMLAGFILVPFGLFSKTAFLAERVLGNVFASGIKVMMLAIVVGIGMGLFSQIQSVAPSAAAASQACASSCKFSIEQAWISVLAAMTLLGLGIHIPGLAAALASGAPQLGAGAAIGTASAVWGAGRAGVSAASAGGSLLSRGYSAASGRASSSGGGPAAGGPAGSGPSGGGPSGGGGAPPWARSMQRRQNMISGVSRVTQALRSGDRGGASTSVNLKQGGR
jgi:type IV secretion system protein TrbL